ncbi:MAG: sialate O-acetylesterase [Akkermansiaceae bacterium]
MKFLTKLLIASTLASVNTYAAVKPSSLFCDHMVLQQGMTVPVWGHADPSEKVTVTFAGQAKTTTTDKDGKWMVKLDALKVSAKGQAMKISGSNKISFKDVLVGEVWICSGQSNMQMGLNTLPALNKKRAEAKNVRHFEVPKVVAFEEQDTVKGRWATGLPNSAVAGGFAHFLEESADVPVGIILSCWGSSSLEAWMPRDMGKDLPLFQEQLDELDGNKETRAEIKRILETKGARKTPDDIYLRRQSNILYNAMIAPLVPYACRGLVWYQGERNASNYDKLPEKPWYRRNIPMVGYGNALKLWIERYRKEWGKEDMHFMVVMLPGYAKGFGKVPENPTVESWAWMREQQLQALELPHTSVVNAIDLGHETNIHPKDKLPIGERLALLAQRDTLAKDIVAEGPVMTKVDSKRGSLIVNFENSKGLKTKDGKAPSAFWVSTDGKRWEPATAEIKGEQVILTSDKVRSPKFIRYAFAAMPKTNLVNAAELPARPFRTDR